MEPFSPSDITENVERLLQALKAEFEPEIIPVQPEDYCRPLNCYINVEEKVKRDSGAVHYGWAIFQTENLIEAHHHAVWESPEEDLIDITPREFHYDKVMFVPDNNFTYTGQLVDNVRLNVTNNKAVDHFIKVCETLEKIYTYGERINDNMMSLPEPARQLTEKYESIKLAYQVFLNSGGNVSSQCVCGNGKVYSLCHGRKITTMLYEDLRALRKQLKR